MPTWSKRDYEFFAEVLRESNAAIGETERLAAQFGGEFAADNPRFDAGRFMKAVKTGALVRESGKVRIPGEQRWSRATYEMTARVLRDAEVVPATKSGLIARFEAEFFADNPRFDFIRFTRATMTKPGLYPRVGGMYGTRRPVRVREHPRRRQ